MTKNTHKEYKEYEKDFYAWAIHNAQLLREGKLSEIDVENIAEEIESIGKSEKRETGVEENNFPKECPFSLQQALDQNFFPE